MSKHDSELTKRVAQKHSKVANAAKKAKKDPNAQAEVAQARQELAEAKITEYVQRILATCEPLSADQRQRLAQLLNGGSRGTSC